MKEIDLSETKYMMLSEPHKLSKLI